MSYCTFGTDEVVIIALVAIIFDIVLATAAALLITTVIVVVGVKNIIFCIPPCYERAFFLGNAAVIITTAVFTEQLTHFSLYLLDLFFICSQAGIERDVSAVDVGVDFMCIEKLASLPLSSDQSITIPTSSHHLESA